MRSWLEKTIAQAIISRAGILLIVCLSHRASPSPIARLDYGATQGYGNAWEEYGKTDAVVVTATTTTPAKIVKEEASSPSWRPETTIGDTGLPKNLIKGLVIAAPLFAALILAPILLTCSRKKLQQRKVRKFQRRDLQESTTDIVAMATNPGKSRKTSASTTVTCLIETTGDELKTESENHDSDRGKPVIISGTTGAPLRALNIRPSLKRNKALFCVEPDKAGKESQPDFQPMKPVKRIRIPTLRPVSMDFGAGVPVLQRAQRNDRKRHSTHVIMQNFAQSESTSHSRLTIIENLAYEDTIPSLPGSRNNVAKMGNLRSGNGCTQFNIPTITTDLSSKDHIPRSVLRRKLDHQYETITCDANDGGTAVTLRRPRLRPPSPVQIKRESKSEDVTIFPVRYSRSSHQYEMMTVDENVGSPILVGTLNNISKSVRVDPGGKKLSIPAESERKPGVGQAPNIYVKTERANEPFQARIDATEDTPSNIGHKSEQKAMPASFASDYQRIRSKSEPKSMRRIQNDIILLPRPPAILEQEAVELAGGQKVKARKDKISKPSAKKKRKNDAKNAVHKSGVYHGKEIGTSEVLRPRRRRGKRKVRKKRRSRDELRQKLQMRLMGFNPVTGVGTGESYRADNNERSSGFVAGLRLKIGPEPGSTDTSGEGQSYFRMRRRRAHSQDDWCGRWGDMRITETTLLEEIWRHLNLIAERSRLLKDSSSSRRRSQSLTSSDSSLNQRRRRSRRGTAGESDIERSSGTSDGDDDGDDAINVDDIIGHHHVDESTSDNGYCTYGHLPSSLRPGLRLPSRPLGGAFEQNPGPSGGGDKAAGLRPGLEASPEVFCPLSQPCMKATTSRTTSVKCTYAEVSNSSQKPPINQVLQNVHQKQKSESDIITENDDAVLRNDDVTTPLREKLPFSTVNLTSSHQKRMSESDELMVKDDKMADIRQDDVVVPLYEKLTDFCSMSSSVSSSCSSLATPNFVPIPQIAKIPQALQEKISLEAANVEEVSRPHTGLPACESGAEIAPEAGADRQMLLDASPDGQGYSAVRKIASEIERQTKVKAPCLYPFSRPARWRQRANSDSNYVVVPPSLLLRRARIKNKIESLAEKPHDETNSDVITGDVTKSDTGTQRQKLPIPGRKSEANVISPTDKNCADTYGEQHANDVMDIKDDVSSKSGSDNVFHDVIQEKCDDDSDESLFHVFMEMAM